MGIQTVARLRATTQSLVERGIKIRRQRATALSIPSLELEEYSLSVVGDLPVVVPDLNTQRATAEVMARLDAAERLLKEQLELTHAIRRDALSVLSKDQPDPQERPPV